MKQKGFTLTELFIVLFIIGLGWFTLLPRLDLTDKTSDPMHQINVLLESAGKTAVQNNVRQQIFLSPGRDFVEWNDKKYYLPAILSRAKINGRPVTRNAEPFNIYPTGHMDELFLILAGGEEIRSRPLLGKIETRTARH